MNQKTYIYASPVPIIMRASHLFNTIPVGTLFLGDFFSKKWYFSVSDSTRSSLEIFGLGLDSNESEMLRLELDSTREKVDSTHL